MAAMKLNTNPTHQNKSAKLVKKKKNTQKRET